MVLIISRGGDQLLQVGEGIPYKYKDFKKRIRIVKEVEKASRGAIIKIYDECVVVSKLEEEPE